MRPEHIPPPVDAWPEPRGLGPRELSWAFLAPALEPYGWAWDPDELCWRWRDET